MTKTAVMPIYAKNSQNLPLWNRKADKFETWYAASSTRVLPSLSKGCPWVDTDLFYCKVKFGPLCFCMGKKVTTMDFSKIGVVYDKKVGRCSQQKEYMKLCEYQRSRSFIDLDPNHSDSIFLIFFSSVTTDFNISSALRWASKYGLMEVEWAYKWFQMKCIHITIRQKKLQFENWKVITVLILL